MQISLKSIIREAFNTAYEQYKNRINTLESSNFLNEDTSAEMADKFSETTQGRAQKQAADKVIDIMSNQKPGWEKYHWDPSGKNGLNWAQWDYIVESLSEMARQTRDPKYGKIFSVIYNVLPERKIDSDGNSFTANSAVVNNLLNMSLQMQDYAKRNPDDFYEALENAWARAFYTDDFFRLLDSYQSMPGANFGRVLTSRISSWTRDLLKAKKTQTRMATNSIDAPNQTTGKPTDVEDNEADLDIDNDEVDDEIMGLKRGDKFDDEEDHTNDNDTNDQADTLDHDSRSKKVAILKYFKFQKAIDKILNSTKTLPLTNSQKQGLFALNQILNHYKTYDEIAAEFPDMFSQTDEQGNTVNAEVKLVQSRLKSILNKVAAPMLKPYGVTPDIFSDPQWQNNNELPVDIVDQIIKQFETMSKAGTSEKRQYTHAFREYAQNHLTPEQIAEKPAQGVYNKEKRKVGSADAVKASIVNLNRNQKFETLADSIMHEFGFPIAFDSIVWSDYWKAGKELESLKGAKKEPVMPIEKNPESDLYPFQRESYEEFLAKNLDLVMERVYNRLYKLL